MLGHPAALVRCSVLGGDLCLVPPKSHLAGAHLIGLGEEVHGVGSLEEVHQGEAVVERRVTVRVALCLREDGAV